MTNGSGRVSDVDKWSLVEKRTGSRHHAEAALHSALDEILGRTDAWPSTYQVLEARRLPAATGLTSIVARYRKGDKVHSDSRAWATVQSLRSPMSREQLAALPETLSMPLAALLEGTDRTHLDVAKLFLSKWRVAYLARELAAVLPPLQMHKAFGRLAYRPLTNTANFAKTTAEAGPRPDWSVKLRPGQPSEDGAAIDRVIHMLQTPLEVAREYATELVTQIEDYIASLTRLRDMIVSRVAQPQHAVSSYGIDRDRLGRELCAMPIGVGLIRDGAGDVAVPVVGTFHDAALNETMHQVVYRLLQGDTQKP
jgi:hypothetical protein